jgi:hypothetical protein
LRFFRKQPDNFKYVFETFDAGDEKVEVAEFPKNQGFYGERYRFKVFNSVGKETFCITLESADEREARNLVLARKRCPS